MRRIGRAAFGSLICILLLPFAGPARAEIELSQGLDRTEVGLDDTFRLTVTVSDAPDSAQFAGLVWIRMEKAKTAFGCGSCAALATLS